VSWASSYDDRMMIRRRVGVGVTVGVGVFVGVELTVGVMVGV